MYNGKKICPKSQIQFLTVKTKPPRSYNLRIIYKQMPARSKTLKRKAAAHRPVTRAMTKAKKNAAKTKRNAKKGVRGVNSVVRSATGASPRRRR